MRSNSLLLGACLCLGALTPPPARAQADPGVVTLRDALDGFHRNSPALALARSRLRTEIAAGRQDRAVPNPVASLGNEDLGDYSERYLTLTQRVDFLWDAPGRRRRADARALLAQARFRADSARLALEVKDAFVRAWERREEVGVLTRVDGVVASLLESASARFAEGDLAGYDVRRLRVERAQAGRGLAQAHVALGYAEERLGSLVGDGVTRLAAAPLDSAAPLPGAGFDAVALALAQRAEVAAARAAAEGRRADADLQRMGMLAGASVGGGFKQQSDGRDGFVVEVRLPLPLTDRRSGAVDASRAAVAGADSEVEWVRRVVAGEASLARARVISAALIADLVGDTGLDEADELLAIARVAYEEGEVGIVELLDAADAFTEAHRMRISARVDAWLAYFELEQAVGGLPDTVDRGDER